LIYRIVYQSKTVFDIS